MSLDDELHRLMSLADAMEASEEVQERRRKIDRREQMYHLDWRYTPPPGVAKAIDSTPRYVGQRAEDKLCAQPFTLTCRAGAELESAVEAWVEQNPIEGMDPEVYKEKVQDLKKQARERADKVEAAAMGLLWRIEAQQAIKVTRAFSRLAVVNGFAGPCRLGYDESAGAEPGVVPLYIQFLDPRSLFVKPDPRAGNGPQLVIYKRQATLDELRYEGWDLGEDQKVDATSLAANTQSTIYDCWEKKRKKSKGKWVQELWHSIILDGPKGKEWILKPINKAVKGCVQIPYVFVPVRPASYLHEDYAGDSSDSFLDAFDANFELSHTVLSWQAQMVQLAVNPPTLQKTEDSTEIDTITPGAQNQVRPQEDAEIMENPWARQEIGQLSQMLRADFQKSTFTEVSFGQGNTQTSGLQTARLQGTSEEALGATRAAVEMAHEQLFNLLALFARMYLAEEKIQAHTSNGTVASVTGSIFRGDEIFEVKLPGMNMFEVSQVAAAFRELAAPRPDGTRFISDETGRELSRIVPWEHSEQQRIMQATAREVVLEEQKAARIARATNREEGAKDMMAQAQTAMEIQKIQAQMQAQAQKQQGEVQKAMLGRATEPNQPQQPGVAATPVGGPSQAPPQSEDWDVGDGRG